MSKTPPILANLPPEVQSYVAAQAAELSGLKQEFLGVSLDNASVQKRLKDEMEAALAAERAAHARAIQNRDAMSTKPLRTPCKRKPFPNNQKTITPSDACEACGGSLTVLETDVMEELEYSETGQKMIQCIIFQ
jgi:hypothetical protein